MKRYIRNDSHLTTLKYSADLAKRFIQYCAGANKKVVIHGPEGFDYQQINGLNKNELFRYVEQFKQRLANDGEPIVFQLSNEPEHWNKIIRLCHDTTPTK